MVYTLPYGTHLLRWYIFLTGILALFNRVIQIEHTLYETKTCSFKIIKGYWTEYLIALFWKLRLVRGVNCIQFTLEDNNWRNTCRSAVLILYQWSDEMSGELPLNIFFLSSLFTFGCHYGMDRSSSWVLSQIYKKTK